MIRSHVLICGGTGCTSSGSAKIIDVMEKQLVENNLTDEIKIVQTGCFGLCANGPIVIVYPEGTFYSHVQPEDVEEIVQELFLKLRENMKIRRFERVEGNVVSYIHGGGRIGVLVNFDTTEEAAATAEFNEMAKDVAAHFNAVHIALGITVVHLKKVFDGVDTVFDQIVLI